jgi:hypothetical protein
MPFGRTEIESAGTMIDSDQAYLEARAEAEIEAARSAAHPAAVRAHYLLAGYYLDRLYGSEEKALPATG